MRAYEFSKNNVKITVFDTPGLADTKGNDEEYIKKIKEKKIEFDLILFCTEMNGTRFRNDDLETMKKLSTALGFQIWNHAVIVLTFADMVFASASQKLKGVSDKEVFGEKFQGLKKTFRQALIHNCGVPEDVAIKVPFVPTGDSMEPRLPDRNDWKTAFWVTVFKRISKVAKAAFLLSSADRLSFPHDSNFDEDDPESAAIRALNHTFHEVTLENHVDVHEESERRPEIPSEGERSEINVSSSIYLDEPSSQIIVQDILGVVTDSHDSTETTNRNTFVRYYHTFLSLIIKYFKRILRRKHQEEESKRQGPIQ